MSSILKFKIKFCYPFLCYSTIMYYFCNLNKTIRKIKVRII